MKPDALEVEQSAEAADFGVGAGPRGGAHQRLDQLHHAVAGIDVDAGLGIGEAAPFSAMGTPWLRARGTSESQSVQWLERRYTRGSRKRLAERATKGAPYARRR